MESSTKASTIPPLSLSPACPKNYGQDEQVSAGAALSTPPSVPPSQANKQAGALERAGEPSENQEPAGCSGAAQRLAADILGRIPAPPPSQCSPFLGITPCASQRYISCMALGFLGDAKKPKEIKLAHTPMR